MGRKAFQLLGAACIGDRSYWLRRALHTDVAGTRKRYSISAGDKGDTYARQTYALERLYA
jgi:hypothetical protein